MNATVKSAGMARVMVTALSFILLLSFLVVPLPNSAEAAAKCATNYTVESGDSLTKVANQFSVTTDELIDANDLDSPYTLKVGQSLCIPTGATVPTAQANSGSTTSSTTKKSTKPSFSASLNGNLVTVEVANYPANGIYTVRVDTYKLKEFRVYKLGKVRLNAKGNVVANFKLPKSLLKSGVSPLNVCIKHNTKDSLTCELVY